MKTKELFEYWKAELSSISNNIQFTGNICDENLEEEEFYFFINKQENTCFYVFYDDWGIGLGIHYSDNRSGHLWYLKDLGISEIELQKDFMLKILKDVAKQERIFIYLSEYEIQLDLGKYKEITNKPYVIDSKRYSITEINRINNKNV